MLSFEVGYLKSETYYTTMYRTNFFLWMRFAMYIYFVPLAIISNYQWYIYIIIFQMTQNNNEKYYVWSF